MGRDKLTVEALERKLNEKNIPYKKRSGKDCLVNLCRKYNLLSAVDELHLYTLEQLKSVCEKVAIPIGANKTIIIEDMTPHAEECLQVLKNLVHKTNKVFPELSCADPSQQCFLDAELFPGTYCIYAGPGAGKTTTLCQKISSLKSQSLCVVNLVFNKAAAETNQKRLKYYGVSLGNKGHEFNKGIHSTTFHKFASMLTGWKNTNNIAFDKIIAKASKILKDRFETLEREKYLIDYLFIDESQDINEELCDFVQTLVKISRISVFAGDPRQQIKDGAQFFSDLWRNSETNKKFKLNYNHRSSKNIVDYINQMSQKMFEERGLHEPQISVKEGGIIYRREVEKNNLGEFMCSEVLNSTDSEILIIAPISVEKYGFGEAIKIANTLLCKAGQTKTICICAGDAQYNEANGIIAACSKKIKGCERRKVIVIGSNLDYQQFGNISSFLTDCSVFVAISRAINELIIVDVSNNRISDDRDISFIPHVSVTDISKNISRVEPEYELLKKFNPLNIGICSDVSGIAIEIFFALFLGAPFSTFDNFLKKPKFKQQNKCESLGLDCDGFLIMRKGETLSFPWKKDDDKIIKIFLFQLACRTGMWHIDKIGEIQEICEKRNIIEDQFRLIVDETKDILEFEQSEYQIPSSIDILTLADKKTCYRLHGIYDFVLSDRSVLEIKYTHNNKFIQASIYSLMINKPVYQLNFFTGELFKVSPFKINNFVDPLQYIRVKCFLRFAKAIKNTKRVKQRELAGKIFSCVDIETARELYCSEIWQFGGVMCYDSGEVLNLGYCTASGADKKYLRSNLGQICSINFDENEVLSSAREYRERIEGSVIHLNWSTNDASKLNIKQDNDGQISVNIIYKTWLKANGRYKKRDTTLTDCVRDIFGENLIFDSHDGFEDAVMTMACFFAMIDWD